MKLLISLFNGIVLGRNIKDFIKYEFANTEITIVLDIYSTRFSFVKINCNVPS